MGEQQVPKDKMQTLKDQVDGVKGIMTENVDRILARGERLDELMEKSEDLQSGVSITIRAEVYRHKELHYQTELDIHGESDHHVIGLLS